MLILRNTNTTTGLRFPRLCQSLHGRLEAMGGGPRKANLGLMWCVLRITSQFASMEVLMPLVMQLKTIHGKLASESRPFFLVRPAGNTVEIGPVEDYGQFFANVPPSSVSYIDLIHVLTD